MIKTLTICAILLVVSVFATLSAQQHMDSTLIRSQISQQQGNEQVRSAIDLEIGELVFDETITKVGKDFYDYFFTGWDNPTSFSAFSITIKERPMPGMGTQIRVFLNENEILSQFMQPNMELIEAMAGYTVQLCQQYLVNYQEIQAQLSSEDQSGTGIF